MGIREELLKETNMKKINRKGFTLVEVLAVLAIVGIVLTMIFSLLFYGFNIFTMTSAEYQVQSGTRLALQQTDRLVRYSTAIFAVPDVTYLDPEWSYIGTNSDHTEIINYKWDATSQTHIEEIMAGPYPDVTFNIGFTKQNNLSTDNSLKLYFETYAADGTTKRYNILSGYEALNALQVINYGTESHPATALAYRNETASYENYKVIVNIAMVLDTSGSMAWDLTGHSIDDGSSTLSRLTILETQAAALVDNFSSNSNSDVSINISLVPFESIAPTPSIFYDIKNANQKTAIKTAIENLDTNGTTNTGDGLRRAFYQLQTKQTADTASATVDTIIKNYTIILVDGDTNTHSMSNSSSRVCTVWKTNGTCKTYKTVWTTPQYYTDSSTVPSCQFTARQTSCPLGYVRGDDGNTTANNYVALMGANLSDPDFATNYVVSFASNVSASQITYIADSTATPTERIYYATDADSLGLSFTEIQMSITNELWRFLGPRLSASSN